MGVGVGVSVCVGGHGMAALQSVGSVGSVGSGWIGSLFLSPPRRYLHTLPSNRCAGA